MKHSLKIILILVSVLLVAEIFGLFVVKRYVTQELPYGFKTPEFEKGFSILQFVIMIAIATVLIFLFKRLDMLKVWKAWFMIAIAIATSISLSAFISSWIAFIAGVSIAILRLKSNDLYVNNLSEILMYGGIVAVFAPIFNLRTAFILLIALSIYDIFSVFFSGHMVEMVKIQEKIDLFSGIVIDYKDGKAMLGGGDIALPLLFASTALKSLGMISALMIIYCAVLSIFLLLMLGGEERYYPALPFITAGAGIGYLFSII